MARFTDAELHHIAEQAVRHIAAGTGFTTIATIGMGADGVAVVSRTGFSPVQLNASYERLLNVAADLERRDPRGLPAYACALILPERDVAYLHQGQTGTGLAEVLTVGRSPFDEPVIRVEVSRGLAELMAALRETQPTNRPAGRAFAHEPGTEEVVLPPMPPVSRPPGYHGRHR